jgi:hypothetical protein
LSYIEIVCDAGGAIESSSPAIRHPGTYTPAMAAIADGLVSAAAMLANARMRVSRWVARMLAPPPIEWPDAPKFATSTC